MKSIEKKLVVGLLPLTEQITGCIRCSLCVLSRSVMSYSLQPHGL